LNSGTDDDNDAAGLGGGCPGTLNFGGVGTSVMGMASFSIEKDGMSGTLMPGTRKTTASGTTLTSLGWMGRGMTACRQQCPILALTLVPLLALPSPSYPCLPLPVSPLPLATAVDNNRYRCC
jgi:hypothetical protein